MLEEENILEVYNIWLLEKFYNLAFAHKKLYENCLFNNTIDIILYYFIRFLSVLQVGKHFHIKYTSDYIV